MASNELNGTELLKKEAFSFCKRDVSLCVFHNKCGTIFKLELWLSFMEQHQKLCRARANKTRDNIFFSTPYSGYSTLILYRTTIGVTGVRGQLS